MPGASGIFWRSETCASKDDALKDRQQFWAGACLFLWFASGLTLAGRLLIEDCSSWIGLGVILIVQLAIFFSVRYFIGLRRFGSLPLMIGLIALGWVTFPWLVC